MPPFFEQAAVILSDMAKAGLIIPIGSDPRPLIFRIACHVETLGLYQPSSHADAATRLLDDVLATKLATCEARRRPRMIAIIGTRLGNIRFPPKMRLPPAFGG